MIRYFAAAALAGICLAAGISARGTVTKPVKPAKKHILVVTFTSPSTFRHQDTIGPSSDLTKEGPAQGILRDLGAKSGAFDCDFCRTQADVMNMLTLEGLKKYDGVIFCNTTGNLAIPDLHGFIDWIRAGHAFVGMHSAGDTYHPNQVAGDTAYIDMIGCEFRTHGAQSEVECFVEDPKHPAVKHLAPSFKIKDEIYHFKVNNRASEHVLLALKQQGMDGVRNEAGEDTSGKPTDMLISWCKMYGKGKVFYTALGHRPDVWANPQYQDHLLGGIKWALGLAKGDATPGSSAPPTK